MFHVQHTNDTEYGGRKKTLPVYLFGLVLCLILTLFSFGIVEYKLLPDSYLYIFLSLLGIIQLIVQSLCFLRLNNSTEGKWNLLPFLFVILIITILVGGTLWIMYNLNYNMMH